MSDRKLVYVADDEPDILDLVSIFLKKEGYDTRAFSTGDALYAEFKQHPCDLVILDIMMPGTDGLTICSMLRSQYSIPVIMLTAKDTDAEYAEGIAQGSDDYLVKPFRPAILMLRVKALLRRDELSRSAARDKEAGFKAVVLEPNDIAAGDLIYRERQHSIYLKDEQIPFTETELMCMTFLMKRWGEAVSREMLLEQVWGFEVAVESRAADEAIRRTRKKLKAFESRVQIKSKWGFGYVMCEEE